MGSGQIWPCPTTPTTRSLTTCESENEPIFRVGVTCVWLETRGNGSCCAVGVRIPVPQVSVRLMSYNSTVRPCDSKAILAMFLWSCSCSHQSSSS
mmetsp:Transcript_12026/g.25858  ORF Transcript_12026/g.25858 Transcript_12026/m.25858 type:complete len:95 (+) Transcript_12026:1287-1571(+)